MKKSFILTVFLSLLFVGHLAAQTPVARIAVLDFSAGTGVLQSDVNGLSSIFNNYFNPPAEYAVVERTRVSRILEEQGIQGTSITEKQRVKLGEILNVSVIVIGDVNIVFGQYNVDVRAVNVQTGEIIAKDGVEIAKNSSYRDNMRLLAERMSSNLPVLYFNPKPKPEPKPVVKVSDDPFYRSTGGSLRFLGGATDVIFSMAYNYQITSSFLIGGGVGYGFGRYEEKQYYNGKLDNEYERIDPAIPVYLETEFRTPRYKWSLFVNLKVGMHFFFDKREDYDDIYSWATPRYTYDYKPLFASCTFGGSWKNLNLGVGITTAGWYYDVPITVSLSYNLPLKTIKKGLF